MGWGDNGVSMENHHPLHNSGFDIDTKDSAFDIAEEKQLNGYYTPSSMDGHHHHHSPPGGGVGRGMGRGKGMGMGHARKWRDYAATKMSTEYDSEGGVFLNKLSASLFDGLAKLKASFERGPDGVFSYPLLGIVTKHLSVLYDHDDMNALVTLSGNLGRNLHLKYLHDIKAEQGDLKIRASGFNNRYRAELGYEVPPAGRMPKASFTFPLGEVKVEEEYGEDDETGQEFRTLGVKALVGARVFGGLAMADYVQESVNLKYMYKDAEMTLMPSIRFPQEALSIMFKRQFSTGIKASYNYNFQSTRWSGVIKHTPVENFKLKLGYDSDVRLCWASAWVGKEDSGAKKAPRKCKLQIMVQVPQDDVQSAVILFRIKKRWDL